MNIFLNRPRYAIWTFFLSVSLHVFLGMGLFYFTTFSSKTVAVMRPIIVAFPSLHLLQKNSINQFSELDFQKKKQNQRQYQNKNPEKLKLHTHPEKKSQLTSVDNIVINRSLIAAVPMTEILTSSFIKNDHIPKIISRINPIYSSWARCRGLEGDVSVIFDVNNAGRVKNIRVLFAQPRNIFERDIRLAMRSWRYESGNPTRNLRINFKFYLENFSDRK